MEVVGVCPIGDCLLGVFNQRRVGCMGGGSDAASAKRRKEI